MLGSSPDDQLKRMPRKAEYADHVWLSFHVGVSNCAVCMHIHQGCIHMPGQMSGVTAVYNPVSWLVF